jgi:hypothetical protein
MWMYTFGATGFPARKRVHSRVVYARLRQGDKCIQAFTANITVDDPFEMADKSATSLRIMSSSKGVLTVQKEADQIYSGWKEKLG